MVAGSKRRKIEDTKPLDLDHLETKLYDMEPRDSCLVALLYLSGRRITEILGLKKKDFKIEDKRISFETFNEKVYRKKQTGAFTILIGDRYYERIRPHWRTDIGTGKRLTIFVAKRLGSLSELDHLFNAYKHSNHPIGYQMAYKIVRFNFPDTWPHLYRHERFTEVAKAYRSDPVAMHRFTFHKRFESTLQYIRDLEEEKI